DDLLPDLLELLRGVASDGTRGRGIEALAARLPASLAREMSSLAAAIEDPRARAEALGAVAAALPKAEAEGAFDAAGRAALKTAEPLRVLVRIADAVPLAFVVRLASIAAELPEEGRGDRLDVYAAVVGRCAELKPVWALGELRDIAGATGHVGWTALDRTA